MTCVQLVQLTPWLLEHWLLPHGDGVLKALVSLAGDDDGHDAGAGNYDGDLLVGGYDGDELLVLLDGLVELCRSAHLGIPATKMLFCQHISTG